MAMIARAELTEPYALLLAGSLAEDVLAEAETIKARAAKELQRANLTLGSPLPLGVLSSALIHEPMRSWRVRDHLERGR